MNIRFFILWLLRKAAKKTIFLVVQLNVPPIELSSHPFFRNTFVQLQKKVFFYLVASLGM